MNTNIIYKGDAKMILKTLPNKSVDMVITSPPYWGLRDYGVDGQIGQEEDYGNYLQHLMFVFDEIQRVLKDTGTLWVNLDDTYGTGSGSGIRKGKQSTNRGTQTNKNWQKKGKTAVKGYEKSLLMIPARFAICMIERGWILRNEIIWHKPNTMPESVKDRFTVDFEKLLFFVKNQRYLFNRQTENSIDETNSRPKKRGFAGKNNGKSGYSFRYPTTQRNKRCVWTIPTKPFPQAHFAVYPENLLITPILAGSPKGGVVLDPFMGSGTTAVVARKLGRNYIGIELNPSYVEIAEKRLSQQFLFI